MRVAIVTGAARGIGAAIAHRLAADGMAVAVVDLDEQRSAHTTNAIIENGGRAIAVGADIADEKSAENAVQRTVSELGPVTVLINNAGIIRDNLIFKMSTDDWDAVMNVHLRGAFLMTRAAQIHMTQEKWGRIVNLSSTSALGNRGQANYAAAKAGLVGFTSGAGTGQVWGNGERDRARLCRDGDDPGICCPSGHHLRGLEAGGRPGHPRRSNRAARGCGCCRKLPLPARSKLRLRPGHLCQWRRQGMTCQKLDRS